VADVVPTEPGAAQIAEVAGELAAEIMGEPVDGLMKPSRWM